MAELVEERAGDATQRRKEVLEELPVVSDGSLGGLAEEPTDTSLGRMKPTATQVRTRLVMLQGLDSSRASVPEDGSI